MGAQQSWQVLAGSWRARGQQHSTSKAGNRQLPAPVCKRGPQGAPGIQSSRGLKETCSHTGPSLKHSMSLWQGTQRHTAHLGSSTQHKQVQAGVSHSLCLGALLLQPHPGRSAPHLRGVGKMGPSSPSQGYTPALSTTRDQVTSLGSLALDAACGHPAGPQAARLRSLHPPQLPD